MPSTLQTRWFDSTRGRIVQRLRAGGLTVDEIAAQLGLSHNAVRVQLTSLERDGLVHHARTERRTTRPSHVFELTADAQQWLSTAYVPFLTHLVGRLAQRLTPQQVERLMRDAGRSLAEALRARAVTTGPLAARAAAASVTLNEAFGAATRVEPINRHVVIRGDGCPLGAVTGGHPPVCLAIETFLAEMTHTRVRECCSRRQPPQCCFELETLTRSAGQAPRRRPGRRG